MHGFDVVAVENGSCGEGGSPDFLGGALSTVCIPGDTHIGLESVAWRPSTGDSTVLGSTL